MSNYWQDRFTQGQAALTAKNEKQINRQMQKYYARAAKSIIEDFINTYNHLLNSIEEGRQPTPADLYKLEKYWQMQGNLRKSLNNLGEIVMKKLTEVFELNFFDIYNGLDLPVDMQFSNLSHETVKHLINSVWCADGKTWSARVWENTSKLADALNEELINTLLTGKKTTDLKNRLQDHFNVSYAEANRLVRTELAHIQTIAAEQRYKDSGIEWAEVWADKDERQCKVCGKLHKTKYRIGEKMPIPAHPNCRCCIVPVIEKNSQLIIKDDKIKIIEKKEKVQNNKNLTNKSIDVKLNLSEEAQQAQDRLLQLTDIGDLHLKNYNKSHRQHAIEFTELPEDTETHLLFQAYEKICTDFFKQKIDEKIVDAFIDADGILHLYNKETNVYGTLFNDNKIGSIYHFDDNKPLEKWEKLKKSKIEEKKNG